MKVNVELKYAQEPSFQIQGQFEGTKLHFSLVKFQCVILIDPPKDEVF